MQFPLFDKNLNIPAEKRMLRIFTNIDSLASVTLRWSHNERDGVSNHQPHDCLLNCLFRRRSKKTSKRRVTGFCVGNSLGTGEFPAQMASYAENVSIWWRHHEHIGWRSGHYFILGYLKFLNGWFIFRNVNGNIFNILSHNFRNNNDVYDMIQDSLDSPIHFFYIKSELRKT